MVAFVKRRKGLPRLGARLHAEEEVRIVAFGGSLTYDGYYLASMVRMLGTAFPKAIIETASRALPGFSCDRGVFRTRSALDLSPDLAIVEFASGDARTPPARIGTAVEGIVRQLRSNDPDRELAFLYFNGLQHGSDGTAQRVVDAWEQVAEYYGIPSFDGNALARWFVSKEVATWFERWPGRRSWSDRRPVGLTFDGVRQTAGGASLFGSHIAQGIITMCNPESLLTQSELIEPMSRAHWGDAIAIGAARLAGEGWVGGPLADVLHTNPIAMCFDELSAAEYEGARLRLPFVGRYAALWTIATGGTVAAAVDGYWSELPSHEGELHHAHELLNESENRRHVLEVEARSLPAVIAGVDLLGQVLPEPASNG